ncbi:hypothetical protein J4220_01285 [Candidatus Micrarchaeota archaeon]|uniref:RuBisCO long chain, Form IV n=1 Tax=uncultured Candidatus Micrarchaeota archaeon TaxID=2220064 RepID=A0A447IUF4_9ARCH|nr:hypothetical protein [Candidatus Micrarchaeota archaeon]VDS11158.1 RuBisCO long chain, Form IV [uncultured Candidatus Micrarchaeota archaeon]
MGATDDFFIQKGVSDSVVVKYLITTTLGPKTAAIKLCKEQSLSNALGNDLNVIKKFSAKFIENSIERVNKNQFMVEVAFPPENCENSLSMMLSAVGGDTFNIKNLYPIKILSISLSKPFYKKYGGPRYGVDGLRKKLKAYSRPILVGPVKPCIGMNPGAFAQRAREALLGGTDIVKDDELICNPPYNPLSSRTKLLSKTIRETERETGEKKMYFAFIGSGTPTQIIEYAEIAKDNGADGYMISPAINGFEIVKELKDEFQLPIIAHNALAYSAYTPNHGMSFSVFSLLQRVCGADIVITPAKHGTFDVMSAEEHKENISVLHSKIAGIKRAFPAFCGGQKPETIPLLKKDAGNNDFIVVAGTSLYDHPDGPTAGAKRLRERF